MSFFDRIDQAHEAYKARHRNAERLVDDVDPLCRDDACQCLSCQQGLNHIAPCMKDDQ